VSHAGGALREDGGYDVHAPLSHDDGLRCYIGYAIEVSGEFPTALVSVDVVPLLKLTWAEARLEAGRARGGFGT